MIVMDFIRDECLDNLSLLLSNCQALPLECPKSWQARPVKSRLLASGETVIRGTMMMRPCIVMQSKTGLDHTK